MGKIDLKSAARDLGVSSFTLALWTRRRQVPHYRLGRRIIFDREELQAWLAERRVSERPGGQVA
jgi:excisionase family DNA binding protein